MRWVLFIDLTCGLFGIYLLKVIFISKKEIYVR